MELCGFKERGFPWATGLDTVSERALDWPIASAWMKTAPHRAGGGGDGVGLLSTTAGGCGTRRRAAREESSEQDKDTPGNSSRARADLAAIEPLPALRAVSRRGKLSHGPVTHPVVLALQVALLSTWLLGPRAKEKVTGVFGEMDGQGQEERPQG